MAISKGKVTSVAVEFKKYIGVAPVKVLAINPTRKELETIYDRPQDKDPEYVGSLDVNGKKIDNVRIDVLLQTVDREGVTNYNLIQKMSFFIRNEYRYNNDRTKVQVIDKYGRTCWVTIDQAKAHEIPTYKNGPANIDSDYRPCYVGEEDLTNFIKIYLNIPNPMTYVNGAWIDNPNVDKAECECRLSTIPSFFKNNFAEIKEVCTYQPENAIQVLFGIKASQDGRLFQTIYEKQVLRLNARDFSSLQKSVEERKSFGALATTTFEFCPIKEYVVDATPLEEKPKSNIPWEDNDLPF